MQCRTLSRKFQFLRIQQSPVGASQIFEPSASGPSVADSSVTAVAVLS